MPALWGFISVCIFPFSCPLETNIFSVPSMFVRALVIFEGIVRVIAIEEIYRISTSVNGGNLCAACRLHLPAVTTEESVETGGHRIK